MIAKRISYLPLGINYASNITVQDVCNLSGFLEAYDNSEFIRNSESEMSKERGTEIRVLASNGVEYEFPLPVPRIAKPMSVVAFLDTDRVQMRLFSNWSSRPSDPMLHFISTPNKLHRCKTALERSSLVTQSEELRKMSMYGLV